MSTTDINENRLIRIEKKIDELNEAFIVLARVEEKIVNLEQIRVESNSRVDASIVSILSEMKELKEANAQQAKIIDDNARITGFIQKTFWIILTAVAGAYVLQFMS